MFPAHHCTADLPASTAARRDEVRRRRRTCLHRCRRRSRTTEMAARTSPAPFASAARCRPAPRRWRAAAPPRGRAEARRAPSARDAQSSPNGARPSRGAGRPASSRTLVSGLGAAMLIGARPSCGAWRPARAATRPVPRRAIRPRLPKAAAGAGTCRRAPGATASSAIDPCARNTRLRERCATTRTKTPRPAGHLCPPVPITYPGRCRTVVMQKPARPPGFCGSTTVCGPLRRA